MIDDKGDLRCCRNATRCLASYERGRTDRQTDGWTGSTTRPAMRCSPVHIVGVQLDYDECRLNPRLCQHICENTLTGYQCRCKLGYQLQADQTTCAPKRPQFSGTLQGPCFVSEAGNSVAFKFKK